MFPQGKPQETYWHLLGNGQKPSEYDIATSKLHYYPEKGFAVKTPTAEWFKTQQAAGRFTPVNWSTFHDPRETTYKRYTVVQAAKEAFVGSILKSMQEKSYAPSLPTAWLGMLDRLLPPLRYAFHGMQMVISYIGHMAPESRLTVVCALQAADEIRRIQTIAQHIRIIQDSMPAFGSSSSTHWQTSPEWQPLRRYIEELLITYDWLEALIHLNGMLKPALEQFLFVEIGNSAKKQGDHLLELIFSSLKEDGQWHWEWTEECFGILSSSEPGNAERLKSVQESKGSQLTEVIESLHRIL